MINKLIWNSHSINRNIEKHLLQIRFSTRLEDLRKFSIGKILVFFRLKRKLRQTILEKRPDIVYISFMPVGWGFWRDLLFALAIKRMEVKTIFHIHNRGIRKRNHRPVYLRLVKKIFSDSLIIHVSQKLIEEEIQPLNLTNARIACLPNVPAETGSFGKQRDDKRVRILFVSNLFPSKGIYKLIRIFRSLAMKHENIELHIMGDFMRKKYETRFSRMLGTADIRDRIFLLGARYGKEKRQAYLNADIFLFPSMFEEECMPLVVLEAMQHALPVVASDIGAISDMVRHKITGFLVQKDDPEKFAQYLERLIGDKPLREQMGRSGYKLYRENYTLDKFEENLHQVILDYYSE